MGFDEVGDFRPVSKLTTNPSFVSTQGQYSEKVKKRPLDSLTPDLARRSPPNHPQSMRKGPISQGAHSPPARNRPVTRQDGSRDPDLAQQPQTQHPGLKHTPDSSDKYEALGGRLLVQSVRSLISIPRQMSGVQIEPTATKKCWFNGSFCSVGHKSGSNTRLECLGGLGGLR